MEWLSKDHSSSPQIDKIHKKLTSALSAAHENDDPLQDFKDDADIEALLGNNDEYRKVKNELKSKTYNDNDNDDDDDDNGSDGTVKYHSDRDGDENDDDDDDEDSLSSQERLEIQRRKSEQELKKNKSSSPRRSKKSSKKSNKTEKWDYALSEEDDDDDDDINNNANLETSEMQKEMQRMQKQRAHQLKKQLSGINNLTQENMHEWDHEAVEDEYAEMLNAHRRLSNASLSIQDVEKQALQTLQEIRDKDVGQQSNTTTPIADILNNTQFNTFPDTIIKNKKNTDTVDIPSQIDGDDYEMITDLNDTKPTISNKILPPKIDDDKDMDIIHQSEIDSTFKQNNDNNNISKIDTKSLTTTTTTRSSRTGSYNNNNNNIKTSPRPIQEIENIGSPLHTTSAQPIMIPNGNSANNSRRNSYSQSYSYSHSQQNAYNNNNNNAAYVVQPQHNGMTDITHYTETQPMQHQQQQQPMQQQLINNNNNDRRNNNDLTDYSNKNPIVRLFRWYLSPMHSRDTLHRLWYHGANAVLSTIICFIMLSLFIFAIIFIPFCGIGLIFIYFQCLLSRHFAIIDSTFSYYFFGSKIFPRFSIFIPKSHEQSIIGALKEYITDPHMLEVILYFTFVKLPASFILSGITMVIFSGVTSILLSPLIFWLDPQYFRDDLYCLFGSKEYTENNIICNGWAVNSFGETFLAFLVFIPTLPLTLHLSNFTAKLLCRITLNFLSITTSQHTPNSSNNNSNKNSYSSQHHHHQHLQHQQYQQNGNLINSPYNAHHHSANIIMNGAGYR